MIPRRIKALLVGSSDSVTRNATLMATGTLASRITGLARLIALAIALGVRPLADAYNLGNNTPNMLYDLLLGGVIASTLLPVLSARFSVHGSRAGDRSVSNLVTVGLVALLAATAVFELAAPLIIGLYTAANHQPGAAAQRVLATELLRLFAPQLFFYGAISIFTAILNLRGNFAAPAFAPIVNNAVAIASLIAFMILYPGSTTESVLAHQGALLLLGFGSTAGVALQMVVLIPVMIKQGIEVEFSFGLRDAAIREILHLSPWTLGFVITNQVALFIVLALADTRAGFVSAYNYAYLFFQLPYAIVSLSIMSAIQPRLARLYATGELSGFRRELLRALRLSVATTIPMAALMFVGASVGLKLVLGYGAVTSAGVELTARALQGFALGLPGFALFLSLVQAVQAIRNARLVFLLYLVENGINVGLALVLLHPEGVFGLSAALAVAYTAAGALALAFAARMHILNRLGKTAAGWVRSAILSAASAALLAAMLPDPGSPVNFAFLLRTFAALLVSTGFFAVAASGLARLSARSVRGQG